MPWLAYAMPNINTDSYTIILMIITIKTLIIILLLKK